MATGPQDNATLAHVETTDTPNIGRVKINENFQRLLRLVNTDANGTPLDLADVATSGTFNSLVDVPNTFEGAANYIVRVNASEDGLVFVEEQEMEIPDFPDIPDLPEILETEKRSLYVVDDEPTEANAIEIDADSSEILGIGTNGEVTASERSFILGFTDEANPNTLSDSVSSSLLGTTQASMTRASGSTMLGGVGNTITGEVNDDNVQRIINSAIIGGSGLTFLDAAENSALIGGTGGFASNATASATLASQNGTLLNTEGSGILGGINSAVAGNSETTRVINSYVIGGNTNIIAAFDMDSVDSAILGGNFNVLDGPVLGSNILGGTGNLVAATDYSTTLASNDSSVSASQYVLTAATNASTTVSTSMASAVLATSGGTVAHAVHSLLAANQNSGLNGTQMSANLASDTTNLTNSDVVFAAGTEDSNVQFSRGVTLLSSTTATLRDAFNVAVLASVDSYTESAGTAAILSGYGNAIYGDAFTQSPVVSAAIGTGTGNTIRASDGQGTHSSAIVAGTDNTIETQWQVATNTTNSAILAGYRNTMASTSDSAIVAGRNHLFEGATASSIIAGDDVQLRRDHSRFHGAAFQGAGYEGASAIDVMFSGTTHAYDNFGSMLIMNSHDNPQSLEELRTLVIEPYFAYFFEARILVTPENRGTAGVWRMFGHLTRPNPNQPAVVTMQHLDSLPLAGMVAPTFTAIPAPAEGEELPPGLDLGTVVLEAGYLTDPENWDYAGFKWVAHLKLIRIDSSVWLPL